MAGRRLPPNVRRHRSKFRGVVTVDGDRLHGPSCDTADEAAQWVRDVRATKHHRAVAGITLADSYELLRQSREDQKCSPFTLRNYRARWELLTKHHLAADVPVRAVDAVTIERIVAAETRRTSAAGGRTLLTMLGMLLNEAFRAGYVTTNEARRVRAPKHRQRSATAFTMPRIREMADQMRAEFPVVADLVLIAASTGMRRIELSRMRATDPDFDLRTVLVRGKSKNHTIRLAQQAIEPLRRAIAAPHSDRTLFENPDMLTYRLRVARAAIGEPNVTWHSFRRSFATDLIQQGVSVYVIQQLLGHGSLQQTVKYLAGAEHAARTAVDLLRL